jgi:organic radical activating enzyme
MPSDKIFCNVPWTNLHVYWDGSYGACCSERHPLHAEPAQYNIKHMPIEQWYNSQPMQDLRQSIRGTEPLSICKGCYHEESHGYESRRIRENYKTVIFTEQAFDRSYQQSTFIKDFESNVTDRLPIDWHVDLGNECNLACKMCRPQASSLVMDFYRKNQIPTEHRNSNWTNDDTAWDNFKKSVLDTPRLNRLHFMGGEPLLNKKFRPLLDFLIEHRPDLSVSFVTNGTLIDRSLLDQLARFKSCDLEISIESMGHINEYIRQRSRLPDLLDRIHMAIDSQTDNFNVVLRSVPQLLNVVDYDQYLRFAWANKVSVQGIPLINPAYLKISVLPVELRKTLVGRYQALKEELGKSKHFTSLATGRNTSELEQQLARECDAIISMLESPEPSNVLELQQELCTWLQRWDRAHRLDARDYYPEYRDFLDSIGYDV